MANQLDPITTQLGENSSKYLVDLSKLKKTPTNNSPPLFNPFSIPIKEIPSIPTAKLGNSDEKEIKLFQKIFHGLGKLEIPHYQNKHFVFITHPLQVLQKFMIQSQILPRNQILSKLSQLIPRNFQN